MKFRQQKSHHQTVKKNMKSREKAKLKDIRKMRKMENKVKGKK